MEMQKYKNIALIFAEGLGDGLIYMVLANNLFHNNYRITVFSNVLYQMRNWFPSIVVKQLPEDEGAEAEFKKYDLVVITDLLRAHKYEQYLTNIFVLHKGLFDSKCSMVENLVNVCKKQFKLKGVVNDNGIVIPGSQLLYRKYNKRVILHPTSKDPKKDWPANKYIKLARYLQKENFQPIFTVSPDERQQWLEKIGSEFEVPLFHTINDLANYVYESGYMIGNDSGVGHLAANLRVPTLSLFSTKSRAKLWRPGWGGGSVITPSLYLSGRKFKHLWKQALTVNRVFKAFKKLVDNK